MKNEGMRKQINVELSRLSKGFKALNINHQKGVLKTAQGLLRIQRAYKTMTADNTRYVSLKGKSE
ncbi:hypothetical protein [Treponema sp. R80B11-R83G3]